MTDHAMTPEEFKQRWEGDDQGGGITCDDVADCAIAWGLSQRPRTAQVWRIFEKVLIKANVAKDHWPSWVEACKEESHD